MAAQNIPLSLEEFHRLYDGEKPAYEYWYGAAVQKTGSTLVHGIVQALLAILLNGAGWSAAPEVRLKVVHDAEPVLDLIAIRGKFKGRYPTVAPELCIEIMSRSDALAKTLEKADRYILWGAQCVWVIDPEKRTAWTMTAPELGVESTPSPTWIAPTGTLRIGETSIELPALFAEVDKVLEPAADED